MGPAAPWNVVVPSEARSNQVTAERRVYRLSFVTRETLPLVTIHAQGPSPARQRPASRRAPTRR